MIVPRNRLLWLVAFWFLIALASLGVERGGLLVLAVGLLLGLAAVADMVWARSRGEMLRVELPEVARLTKGRDESLPLRITPLQPGAGRIRIGLTLPVEIESRQDELWVELDRSREGHDGGSADMYEAAWACHPVRRGKHLIEEVHWETASPFGLWGVRGSTRSPSELRVYPDLARERKTVAAFFLNRGMHGLHAHRMVGRGREFERLREYLPGDSYDEIHWKATARKGEPITKVFQVERTQEVYVVIDSSRLTARTPSMDEGAAASEAESGETILERFVSASLVLGMAAEKQGDHFGLLAFGGTVKRFIRANSGKEHFNTCRDALYTLHPEAVAPDLGEVFTFLRLRLRKRALLIFLTSLEDPLLEESFVSQIDLLARKHLVMVNMLRPSGVDRLFSGRHIPDSTSDLYAHLAGHMRWHDIRETGKKMQRHGVRFSLLENERLSPELVSQYMMVKQRQLV